MNNGQIRFFEIPFNDINERAVHLEVIDKVATNTGAQMLKNICRRDLVTGWLTTGSNDSANTELIVDIPDADNVTHIFLLGNNFKNFDVEVLHNGLWENVFSITDNANPNLEIPVNNLSVPAVRIIIHGTFEPDADKELRRLIITRQIYQLEGFPVIKNSVHDFGTKTVKLLSGKSFIGEFGLMRKFELKIKVLTSQNDLDFYEKLFFLFKRGVMVQLSGGNEKQFLLNAIGYRDADFIIARPNSAFKNDFYEGLYFSGQEISVPFIEVAN